MSYYQIGYMAYVAGFAGYYFQGIPEEIFDEIDRGWISAWDEAHNFSG